MRVHDRVYVTFAISEVPQALLDAPEGGELIAPVGPSVGELRPLFQAARPIAVGPPPSAAQRMAELRSAGIGQTVMRYRRLEGRLQVESTIPALYIAGRAFVADRGSTPYA